MLDKKGSVLVMTTAFILVFSLTGFGAMYLSGLQGQASQKHVATAEAFWAAEAGIQKALTHLPDTTALSGSLESGPTYSVNITQLSPIRWEMVSTGQVFPATKRIRVQVGPADPNIIQTTGPLYIGGNVNNKQPFPYDDWADFQFTQIFGITREQMKQKAITDGYYVENPPNDFIPPGQVNVNGITWVECTPGNKLKIVTNGWKGSGILIVMGELEMTGGSFTGVIWVTGELRMAGNGSPVISGTVFVDSGSLETRLTGTLLLQYNEQAVADALINNGLNPGRRVVLWREEL